MSSNGRCATLTHPEPVTLIPSRVFWLQWAAIIMPLLGILYQGFVVLPHIDGAREAFHSEREAELLHFKRIEALRKGQVTEQALLLNELRYSVKMAKTLSKGE